MCSYDECVCVHILICVNTGVHIPQSIHSGQKTTSGVSLYLPPCFKTGFLMFSLCLSGQLGYALLWSLLSPSSTSPRSHWYDRCILLYLALCGFCRVEVKTHSLPVELSPKVDMLFLIVTLEIGCRAWRDNSADKSTDYSSRDPKLNSQQPHVAGNHLSSDLTHIHKIKTIFKEKKLIIYNL